MKKRKNIHLTDKIAREASRRWAILSYKKIGLIRKNAAEMFFLPEITDKSGY